MGLKQFKLNFITKIQIGGHVTVNSANPLLQVAPAELESFLLSHREIQDAAVIGIDDRVSGELPRAFIVRKDDSQITAIEIQKFIEGKARFSVFFKRTSIWVNFYNCTYVQKSSVGALRAVK